MVDSRGQPLSEGELHPFGRCINHESGRHPLGVGTGFVEQPVDCVVPVFRLVMKEDQAATLRLDRQIDRLVRGRVAPSPPGLDDLIRVHGIVDQGVGLGQEANQASAPVAPDRIIAARS